MSGETILDEESREECDKSCSPIKYVKENIHLRISQEPK